MASERDHLERLRRLQKLAALAREIGPPRALIPSTVDLMPADAAALAWAISQLESQPAQIAASGEPAALRQNPPATVCPNPGGCGTI